MSSSNEELKPSAENEHLEEMEEEIAFEEDDICLLYTSDAADEMSEV